MVQDLNIIKIFKNKKKFSKYSLPSTLIVYVSFIFKITSGRLDKAIH